MVSAPGLHPTDQNVGTWWTHKTGTVWGFNGVQYVSRTVTTPGEGYWMKNTLAETYNYPAITIVPHNPIPATLGWNMIGGYETSPTITSLKAANPQITGTVWGFNGVQYVAATNLVPGYGYWVKVTISRKYYNTGCNSQRKRSSRIIQGRLGQDNTNGCSRLKLHVVFSKGRSRSSPV